MPKHKNRIDLGALQRAVVQTRSIVKGAQMDVTLAQSTFVNANETLHKAESRLEDALHTFLRGDDA